MGKLFGGFGLIGLALFMLLGFFAAGVGGPAAIFALLIAVVLPAWAGFTMIKSHNRGGGAVGGRREDLRRQTLEAELLRLAARKQGKLTIIEAVTDLAISPEEAKEALDALSLRGLADFQVTDSGTVVYDFRDIRNLSDKPDARGILE